MKVIKTRNDLSSMVDDNGVVREPVKMLNGVSLIRCNFLTSFKNIHCDSKFSLNGLSGFTSLNGEVAPSAGVFSGLVNVVDLGDFKMLRGTHLYGLEKVSVISNRFQPAPVSSLSGLNSLVSISGDIMWPAGYVLKNVPDETIVGLPEWLRFRLNLLNSP